MYDSINALIRQILPVSLVTGDWDESITMGAGSAEMIFCARWRNVIVMGRNNEVIINVAPDEITASQVIESNRSAAQDLLPAARMMALIAGGTDPGDLVHTGTSLVTAPATVPAAWGSV